MSFFEQLFRAHRTETKGDYLFFRLFEAVIIYQVIYYAWEWGLYIPQLAAVILPLGMAHYIDVSFMFAEPYALANAALVTIFALLGFFKKGRIYYLLALLALHLQYISRYSQGEISHGSNFTATALLALALAALFFARSGRRRKLAFGLFIFLIGLGYTSAGMSKLVGSGLAWADGHHLHMWIEQRAADKISQNGAYELNFVQHLMLDYHWLATVTLAFGMLSELMGFLLWFRKTRWIEATILIVMHYGIYLTMSINFRSYFIIIFLVGYPWGSFFDSLLQKWPDSPLNSYLERRIGGTSFR